MEEIDLGRLVTEAVQQVDLTEVVMEQVDLIGVAEYVVAGIDLPEIIRASTGSVASEAVRGLRMQGVDADLAVARIVDRVLFRRGTVVCWMSRRRRRPRRASDRGSSRDLRRAGSRPCWGRDRSGAPGGRARSKGSRPAS